MTSTKTDSNDMSTTSTKKVAPSPPLNTTYPTPIWEPRPDLTGDNLMEVLDDESLYGPEGENSLWYFSSEGGEDYAVVTHINTN